jgi:hypothetical protein
MATPSTSATHLQSRAGLEINGVATPCKRLSCIERTLKLPPELIGEIIKFKPGNAKILVLKEFEDKKERSKIPTEDLSKRVFLCNLVRKSKTFKEIARIINTEKKAFIDFEFTPEELQNFFSFYPSLKYADLRGYNESLIDDSLVKRLVYSNPGLEELFIPKSVITTDSLRSILGLRNLRILDLSFNSTLEFSDQDGFLIFPQTLLQLNLRGCSRFGNENLNGLPSTLKSLNLDNCVALKRGFAADLPLSLQELSLREAPLEDGDVQFIPGDVETLDVSLTYISEEGLTNLPPKLVNLNLTRTDLTGVKFQFLPKTLKSINLTDCVQVKVLDQLPTDLEELVLDSTLTDEMALSLPRSLQRLKIQGFNDLSAQGIFNLPRTLIKLVLKNKELNKESVANLPPGLLEFELLGARLEEGSVQFLPKNLLYLYIPKSNLTDTEVNQLPRTIKVLDLSATQISDAAFCDLPPFLVSLRLDRCAFIIGKSFRMLPLTLRRLSIANCDGIHLNHLAQLPNSLQVLNIQGNFKLNSQTQIKLPDSLKLLNLSGWKIGDRFKFLPKDLKTLDLSYTEITNSLVEKLPKGLTSLRLAFCDLITNNCIGGLPLSLTMLDVSQCAKFVFKPGQTNRFPYLQWYQHSQQLFM